MRINNCEQGTEEWFAARLGIPTASAFKNIYTSGGKASTSASVYAHKLIAERLMGYHPESYTNEAMERGIELEGEARGLYQFAQDEECRQVGFVTLDDGSTGCSPDGLIDSGGLEIKCPSPHVHVKYLLAGKCPAEYVPQVQGSIWICEADWWDFMSYHPDMQPLIVRVYRDDEYIAGLAAEIAKFNDKLASMREVLAHE